MTERVAAPERDAWVISAGKAGHDVQSLGLAETLGLVPRILTVAPRGLHRLLAPWGPPQPHPEFRPPWPGIAIASSRQTIPYARALRRRSGGRSFTIVLQSPGISPRHFDLVWVPEHDRLRGENVVTTLTAPHRMTRERLDEAAAAWRPRLAHLPAPRIVVLVGGTSGAYRFGPDEGEALGRDLARLARETGGSLLVTASRRTGAESMARLSAAISDQPAFVWTSGPENPLFGFVALADAFVVTCDSANMLGEAAFTGKPLYAYNLPGGSAKFARFHAGMVAHGAMRWFDGGLDRWSYPPLDANQIVADAVRARLAQR
ncbi:mitochondrial fission ELM1 family protein [Lutibaculum baratangense]|uniref:DUF1022 domain-containing protein n=1 Tax=Lutibaculum baratangense AMV1 TaxID=631454 RepID=V4R4Q1_9HYPH|nr:mitochondrial fission ELM1 family protein [Lutibaculum baratangense]ESR26902.1 protein of unknown function DUF1022 [Lutibaculum baratangense AMV1]